MKKDKLLKLDVKHLSDNKTFRKPSKPYLTNKCLISTNLTLNEKKKKKKKYAQLNFYKLTLHLIKKKKKKKDAPRNC